MSTGPSLDDTDSLALVLLGPCLGCEGIVTGTVSQGVAYPSTFSGLSQAENLCPKSSQEEYLCARDELVWDISGCSEGTGSLSVTLGNGVNIWAASERMWLRSQHTAPGKMGQYCYSETFPAKTKLNWVSMGLLPLQTYCKFSTSLICFSLQCTGAQKHDCHMSATFSALVLGQQLFTGFQNCRSLTEP